MGYGAVLVDLGGVRWFATGVADPLAILRMALSPKGACDGLRDFARGFGGVRWFATGVADPLAILRMALSPFQGACIIPLRRFIKGACGVLSEFIR